MYIGLENLFGLDENEPFGVSIFKYVKFCYEIQHFWIFPLFFFIKR
jgi:hypothetical protein